MRKLTTEEFIEKAKKVHGDKYDYSNTIYNGKRNKIIIICPIHGEFEQIAGNHIKGQGCPQCGKLYAQSWRKNNYKYFIEESIKRFGDNFEFINVEKDYINSHSKITLKCKKCGNIFNKIAGDHITSPNGGCQVCQITKLENDVRKLLIENNIKFETQKTFNWLKYKNKLKLDFYLPDYNIAIECQGIQHFKETNFFKEKLEEIQFKDNLKKNLCEENNVKLLYYSDLNIKYPYNVIESIEKLLKIILDI